MNKKVFRIILALTTYSSLQIQAATPATDGAASSKLPNVTTIEDFTSKLKPGQAAVLDVYTTWCGACKKMEPVLQELKEKYSDVAFFSHNAESHPSIKAHYNIKYFPTFILVGKDGKHSVEVGGMPKQEMDYLIQAAKGEIKLMGTDPQQVAAPQPAGKSAQPAAPIKPSPAPQPVQKTAAPAPVQSGAVKVVNSMAELQQHQKNHGGVTALYIGTTWCGPCKKLKPVFKALAEEMKDVLFVSADGDSVRDITSTYLQFGYPNIVIFDKNGNHKSIVGYQAREDLIRELKAAKESGVKQVNYSQAKEVNEMPTAANMQIPGQPAPQPKPVEVPAEKVVAPKKTTRAEQRAARKASQKGRSSRGSRRGGSTCPVA